MSDQASFKSDKIDPLDIFIGKRIRFRRKVLGMTQTDLAKELGVSFQQIQKYEAGENKLYATRLYHIAKILKTPILFFLEEDSIKSSGMSDQEQDVFVQNDLMDKNETATLIRVYYDIQDKKKRKTALEMMKGLQS